MAELPITKQDAVAFFRFQVISEMLDAPKGFIEATAKKLAKQLLKDELEEGKLVQKEF
jgi:hypothetical protein